MEKVITFKKIILQAVILAALGSILGLGYNGLSENGLPYFAKEAPRLRINDPLGRDILTTYEIGLEEAKAAWEAGTGIFLDSREKEKFEMGRILFADNIPYDEFEENLMKLLPSLRSKCALIIYCDGADCDSSVLLAEKMLDSFKDDEEVKIYDRLKIFYDGWHKWLKAGLPTEPEEDEKE